MQIRGLKQEKMMWIPVPAYQQAGTGMTTVF